MTDEEDYSKPRNLAASLFEDLELPEQSHIMPKIKNEPNKQPAHKYKYEDDSD